ncbi:NRAMP family divalent metal transporter [Nocardioides mesophilus]|uniref:Divalent metal cation transporter n=1 Tax=Nocardioides mesophilus TaxID=433659 RepID=A0A7G9RD51_9ACTN|nr:divalent metal cation transporter [Nocardioides mesophilus]QNN53526.1 divalent metal cation transporter [Nocardioides mesophilus]
MATTRQSPSRDRTRLTRVRLAALVAVLGPGLLAGLSDDDPAGITTYSVLGADYGYQLLWVLLLATLALIVFHSLGARMGVATGQGLIGLVRDRYGVRLGSTALVLLVTANVGTTCAEFAGIAAGFELFGVSRYVSVPLAAALVCALVLRGSFHRVEHLLMALASVFVAYVVAGFVAGPDWGEALRGLVVPTMPLTRDAIVVVTATVGTTLAPWGLSFIQSYAVDKKLTADDLGYERVDVVTGSVLTGVIGFFVVVTCAATLHVAGTSVSDAADAAQALEPLAGRFAATIFGVGLIGAAVLAAAVLPLSTAYSVCEFTGHEGALDDGFRRAPLFYATFLVVATVAAGAVLVPGLPLVPVLVLTQVLNAVLLLPLLVFMYGLSRDPTLMGEQRVSRASGGLYLLTIAFIAVCVGALFVLGLR